MNNPLNILKRIDERFFQSVPEVNSKLGHMVSALILSAWLFVGIFVLSRVLLSERIFLISAMTGSLVLNTCIKYALKRERPSKIDAFSNRFHISVQKASFPSCHAQLAFTALPLIWWYYPSLLLPVLFLAFITAVSRLTFGRHWFSDIIAGVIIGYFVGKIFIPLL